ncbi:MAG: hypothetical protein M3N16_00370 [Actinomycetota bacterium]|nr:hypothetical protein [Actinomycetota bacterium]
MAGVAAISAGQLLFVFAACAVVLTPAVVTVLKGHLALFVAGFLFVEIIWLLAAFRLEA